VKELRIYTTTFNIGGLFWRLNWEEKRAIRHATRVTCLVNLEKNGNTPFDRLSVNNAGAAIGGNGLPETYLHTVVFRRITQGVTEKGEGAMDE